MKAQDKERERLLKKAQDEERERPLEEAQEKKDEDTQEHAERRNLSAAKRQKQRMMTGSCIKKCLIIPCHQSQPLIQGYLCTQGP